MVLLALFAFIAGAGTALSPCVLPVLPAVLSAGATGGRRRPVGVVIGLTVTFTVTIAGLGAVADGVGLGNTALRTVAVIVLLAFGLALLVPRLADLVEARLSRLAALGPRRTGDGFVSGLAVGGALGFAYAPCAGPILAAVITVGAASGNAVAIALAYSAGSAVVLLAFALGGRKLGDRIRRAGRGPTVQRAVGVIMLLTALAVATNLDVRFQTTLATHFPSFVVDPAHGIERSSAAQRRLAELRGRPRFTSPPAAHPAADVMLPVLGTAPDFTGTQRWFNTAGDRPLTLAQLRGKVVLVDFWTYTCINCLRTLPYVKAWSERYKRDGLVVVGVHTPEFQFEHDASNVAEAIRANGLHYPVAQDNDYATWNAWDNQSWPAKYLIDAQGRVRYVHIGEGEYPNTESAIRSLLRERGDTQLAGTTDVHARDTPGDRMTPETYIGAARAAGWLVQPTVGVRTYPGAPDGLPQDRFALGGTWNVTQESAQADAGAEIDAHVTGKAVYIVLSPGAQAAGRVRVDFDGGPIPDADAGDDVHHGVVTVRRQRLYRLVALPKPEHHELALHFDPGVQGFAFTFG
jgi:cytochrome c biogenesis protein CcdA/thiol-disulfide isomerase/thioredoxin